MTRAIVLLLVLSEPIVRPVGTNRIEVQLPALNTKDNPDVVNNVKAPARLDFRTVHPTLTPGAGAGLLAAYALGLGVPFLLAAIMFSYFGLQRRAWQQGGADA